jgi:hypothetical protein
VSGDIAGKVAAAGRNRGARRLTIGRTIEAFRHVVEAHAVNAFWDSRTKGKLKRRPEKLAQEIFGVFASTFLGSKGSIIREAVSGVGFVDVFVTFSGGILHVLELKMLKGNTLPGPSQLMTYMKHQKRKEGWLIFFDVRPPTKKTTVPTSIRGRAGIVRTVLIDLNPIPPSKQPELVTIAE